ncbi:MAG: Gfo/Idh/MocA family oxidoreductase [Opitutae bacterium]|nr:Gfo/Idh/MocA family oxidoreductase [Opitutae bacterium]
MSKNYELKTAAVKLIPAPALPYLPPAPKRYRPKLGLIGCGGITENHLKAARALGVEVVAFSDVNRAAAEKRRAEFFPQAEVYEDYRQLLARDDIAVVDIATHPAVRVPLIEAALRAGKHVLSQKPFVLDLVDGRRLVRLADKKGLRLAVNQNGRWAPYFSYLLQAVRAGVLGPIHTLDLAMNWDHTWCQGTQFEKIRHLVLYDFGIHWFDITAAVFAGRKPRQVFAQVATAPGQKMQPPMLAHAVVDYGDGLATLSFSAHAKFGAQERLAAVGAAGTLRGSGALCGIPELVLHTSAGEARVALTGNWFPDGFRGALGELLCAIEEDREPGNSARGNLASLELCFAALRSADTDRPQRPGRVSKLVAPRPVRRAR